MTPAAETTIKIKVENFKAFTVAVEALHAIAAAEPDTDEPDTRERSYGTCAEMAQEALDAIKSMGVPTQRGAA